MQLIKITCAKILIKIFAVENETRVATCIKNRHFLGNEAVAHSWKV